MKLPQQHIKSELQTKMARHSEFKEFCENLTTITFRERLGARPRKAVSGKPIFQ